MFSFVRFRFFLFTSFSFILFNALYFTFICYVSLCSCQFNLFYSILLYSVLFHFILFYFISFFFVIFFIPFMKDYHISSKQAKRMQAAVHQLKSLYHLHAHRRQGRTSVKGRIGIYVLLSAIPKTVLSAYVRNRYFWKGSTVETCT